MAFSAAARVRIANASSQWRNNKIGTVKTVLSGSQYAVRLDGHSCGQTQQFAETDLKATTLASPIDYARCA